MPDETTRGLWQSWLEAEIARCEGALIAAPPHGKFEVWQRLDLLHALRDGGQADGEPTPLRSARGRYPALRRWVADGLLFSGAVVLGAALAWLVGGRFGLAI